MIDFMVQPCACNGHHIVTSLHEVPVICISGMPTAFDTRTMAISFAFLDIVDGFTHSKRVFGLASAMRASIGAWRVVGHLSWVLSAAMAIVATLSQALV